MCCFAYCYYCFKQEQKRNRIHDLVDLSNGTFDKQARQAQEEFLEIQDPSRNDKFTSGRITQLNQFEGNVNNIPALRNVVQNYQFVLDDPDLDWFELEQIETFANRHRHFLVDTGNDDFLNTVSATRANKSKITIEQAKESADTKNEAFKLFVDDNTTQTSDPHNVHDSSVNRQLEKNFATLSQRTIPISGNFTDIKNAIINYTMANVDNVNKQNKIRNSLNVISQGNYNSSVRTCEDELLSLVWSRAYDSDNKNNEILIKDAVLDALVDMSDDDATSIVCSSGRCSRLMASLTLLDADKNIANGYATTEQIRNEALESSHKILDDCIASYSKHPDDNLRTAALSYNSPEIKVGKHQEENFKTIVKDKIVGNLDSSFKQKMAEKDFDNVKTYCIDAINSI